MTLSSPKFLTKQIHTSIFNDLQNTLLEMKASKEIPEGMKTIRIRNWLFLYDEGTPTVDIILDKGYHAEDLEKNTVPRLAHTALTFDECTFVHEFILASKALDPFSDEVSIRVGTPGSEPTLFLLEDYQSSIGNMVKIETWDPKEGRSKFTMILVDIFQKEGNSVAVVCEGSKRIEIPVDDIKSAFVLPFHPASQSMKQAKKVSQKKKK